MFWLSLDVRGRDVLFGAAFGVSLVFTSASLAAYVYSTRQQQQRPRKKVDPQFSARPIELRSDEVVDGIAGLIGKYDNSKV